MDLAHFRILNNEMLNKDPDMVIEQARLPILDIKSTICMTKNSKYTKQTRHIPRRMNLVRNS